jgi:hypothetical protein
VDVKLTNDDPFSAEVRIHIEALRRSFGSAPDAVELALRMLERATGEAATQGAPQGSPEGGRRAATRGEDRRGLAPPRVQVALIKWVLPSGVSFTRFTAEGAAPIRYRQESGLLDELTAHPGERLRLDHVLALKGLHPARRTRLIYHLAEQLGEGWIDWTHERCDLDQKAVWFDPSADRLWLRVAVSSIQERDRYLDGWLRNAQHSNTGS